MENTIILIIFILSTSYIAKNTKNDVTEGISVFFAIIGSAIFLVHFMAWVLEPSTSREFIKKREVLVCDLEKLHYKENDTIIIKINHLDSINPDLKLMTDIINWNTLLRSYQKNNQSNLWDCYIDDGVMNLNPIKIK